jgi:hypothetical protein
MKKPKEFTDEFEALLIKYEVSQCISVFPMEGLTRTIAYATKKEDEVEISQTFDKLSNLVGGLNVTNTKALIELIEKTFEAYEREEVVITQVTWEKMAYDNAERVLSEEDFADLENSRILKLAAVEANEWELAATHREVELKLLSKVIDDINKFD